MAKIFRVGGKWIKDRSVLQKILGLGMDQSQCYCTESESRVHLKEFK